MSKIRDIVIRNITRYNNDKIGQWDKPQRHQNKNLIYTNYILSVMQ